MKEKTKKTKKNSLTSEVEINDVRSLFKEPDCVNEINVRKLSTRYFLFRQ